MRKRLTQNQLLQKHWDNWCDEQFSYIKGWAWEVAGYIYRENLLSGIELDCRLKIQSVIMQSMLGDDL